MSETRATTDGGRAVTLRFEKAEYEARLVRARAGEPVGRIAEVFLERLDRAGFARQRFAACGYSLGATFRPSWMDVPPMIHAGNRQELLPGMVLFPHVMLGDMEAGTAAGVGWTILVGERGAEVLSRLPLELHRR